MKQDFQWCGLLVHRVIIIIHTKIFFVVINRNHLDELLIPMKNPRVNFTEERYKRCLEYCQKLIVEMDVFGILICVQHFFQPSVRCRFIFWNKKTQNSYDKNTSEIKIRTLFNEIVCAMMNHFSHLRRTILWLVDRWWSSMRKGKWHVQSNDRNTTWDYHERGCTQKRTIALTSHPKNRITFIHWRNLFRFDILLVLRFRAAEHFRFPQQRNTTSTTRNRSSLQSETFIRKSRGNE